MRRALVALLTLPLIGLVAVGPAGAADRVERVSGTDRVLTAIALSQRAFPTDGSAPAAVVARDREFADALAAAPLAVAAGGPVLLNPRDALAAEVQTELERLGVETVYLMGGTAAQSAEVERALSEDTAGVTTVVRVEDPDHPNRYGTAAEAARRAAAMWGGSAGQHVLIALGSHPEPHRAWPDALSAGQLAGHARRPILLVTPGQVPAATDQALNDLGSDIATVIGGTAAIPESVAAGLDVGTVRRIGGATRYDTARLVADAAAAAGGGLGTVVAATGANYPDGLAAGPTAVHLGGVMALVHPTHLADSPHAHDWFADHRATIGDILVAGGQAAVDDAVLGHLDAATSNLAQLQLSWQTVVDGLDSPVDVEVRPGDPHVYVAEQTGVIWRTFPDGGKQPFFDISQRVLHGGERGLLGFTFHPTDPSRLFVYYTRVNANNATRLAEYRIVGDDADDTNEAVLDDYAQPASNHNGGGLEFAPDGTLWLALGDGGGGNDQYGHGQNTSTQLGTLLRYRVGTQAGDAAPPSDNPFAKGGGDPFIAHFGLRNPFRFSFDAVDARVFIGDVGQGKREEIDAVGIGSLGRNFGWPCREGTLAGPSNCTGSFTDPVAEYATHQNGTCAVTGGVVYRGRALAELAGTYLYADYCQGSLRTLRVDDAGVAREFRTWTLSMGNPSGFGTDHDGEIYATDLSGRLLKLVRG